MSLQPHQQRVVDERAELADRTKKLIAFLDTPVFDALDKVDQRMLIAQGFLMESLRDLLDLRIERFGAAA